MLKQQPPVETFKNTDGVVFLPAENPDENYVTEGVLQFYMKHHMLTTRETSESSAEKPWLFIPGKNNGSNPTEYQKPFSEMVKKDILEQAEQKMIDIPERNIACETESLDMIANFYYLARDYLNPIFSEKQDVTVALITDEQRMTRAYWTANKMLSEQETGKNYTILPLETKSPPYNNNENLKETALLWAWKTDLMRYDIDTYMKDIHPFHGKNPNNHLSMYNTGLKIVEAYRQAVNKNTPDQEIEGELGKKAKL